MEEKDAEYRNNQTEFLKGWVEKLKLKLDQSKQEQNQFKANLIGEYYSLSLFFYSAIESWQIVFFMLEEFEIKGYRELAKDELYLDEILTKADFESPNMAYVNRSMVIDAWSKFENNLYEFVRVNFSEAELDYLKIHRYRDVINKLGNSDISEKDEKKLKKSLKVNEISILGASYLLDKVFDKCPDYKGDQESDKSFLKSVGRYRNLMHNGFINLGGSFSFTFGDYNLNIPKGKSSELIDVAGQAFHDIKAYPVMIDKMLGIWCNIADSFEAN